MDPSDIAFVKGAVAFVVIAATGLSAFRIWIRARNRPLPAVDQEAIGAIREESALAQAELETRIAALEERLDFTERLLAQERKAPQLSEQHERPSDR